MAELCGQRIQEDRLSKANRFYLFVGKINSITISDFFIFSSSDLSTGLQTHIFILTWKSESYFKFSITKIKPLLCQSSLSQQMAIPPTYWIAPVKYLCHLWFLFQSDPIFLYLIHHQVLLGLKQLSYPKQRSPFIHKKSNPPQKNWVMWQILSHKHDYCDTYWFVN